MLATYDREWLFTFTYKTTKPHTQVGSYINIIHESLDLKNYAYKYLHVGTQYKMRIRHNIINRDTDLSIYLQRNQINVVIVAVVGMAEPERGKENRMACW